MTFGRKLVINWLETPTIGQFLVRKASNKDFSRNEVALYDDAILLKPVLGFSSAIEVFCINFGKYAVSELFFQI